MLATLASATAFAPLGSASPAGISRTGAMNMIERSVALPFLKKPPALDGKQSYMLGGLDHVSNMHSDECTLTCVHATRMLK